MVVLVHHGIGIPISSVIRAFYKSTPQESLSAFPPSDAVVPVLVKEGTDAFSKS